MLSSPHLYTYTVVALNIRLIYESRLVLEILLYYFYVRFLLYILDMVFNYLLTSLCSESEAPRLSLPLSALEKSIACDAN